MNIDDFCVVIYQDASEQTVGRAVTMCSLSEAWSVVDEQFVFSSKTMIYACYQTPDVTDAKVTLDLIDLVIDNSDGQGTAWKLLEELAQEQGQDESGLNDFFQELCDFLNRCDVARKRQKYTKPD